MSYVKTHVPGGLLFHAPRHRYRRFAFGSYGFGHTNMRQPGDLRGTAVGIKGRFRMPVVKGGEA